MSRINVMQPWLGPEEIAAVTEVISSGWVAQGPRVAAFEQAFAQAMDVPHAVATSSCTTALHLALVVAGVQAGDEVVVPSFSFIATTNAPTYVGARPVFADVDPVTGNLTAETVAAVLPSQTERGVIRLATNQSCALDFDKLTAGEKNTAGMPAHSPGNLSANLPPNFSGGLAVAVSPDTNHTLFKVEVRVREWKAYAFTHFRPGLRSARWYQKPKPRGGLATVTATP